MSPSIHFRHKNNANIGWIDGHISNHVMADSNDINAYGINSSHLNLGWLNPINNSLFDLK
jgi:prepilin-type processing-associated H-X9-DG protein